MIKNLGFDERFGFHFYDLDLCRQAEQRGIRTGTWPISVVHESGGNFGRAGRLPHLPGEVGPMSSVRVLQRDDMKPGLLMDIFSSMAVFLAC